MTWTAGDISSSETLTSSDHLYASHINELRETFDDQVVDPKLLGLVGDGSTDDRTALQLAATRAQNGGVLLIPGVPIYVSGDVALYSDTRVRGISRRRSIINTAMAGGSNHRGIFTIANQDDIDIADVGFDVGGTSTALSSYGHDGLKIRRCAITGTTAATFAGVINLDGNAASASMLNTTIDDNDFYSLPNVGRVIHIYPRAGHTVEILDINKNRFTDTTGPCILLDTYDTCIGLTVTKNQARDTLWVGGSGGEGVLLHGGLASANHITGLLFAANYYRNTLTAAGQQQGLIYIYASRDVTISKNVAIGSWTPSQATEGPGIAPGRTSSPDVSLTISDNYFEGFDSVWDPDSMQIADVHDNTAYACGHGWDPGYGTQKHVNIHHNINYNSPHNVTGAGINCNSGTPTQCDVNDNIFIDDRVSPVMTSAVRFTGHTDYSDMKMNRNRWYVPSGALTPIIREFGDEVVPTTMEGNEIHDSAGLNMEVSKFAQGNVTGATRFNAAKGAIITATLTGNITVTLTSGKIIGQILQLRLTQDGTGSRTVTWPANFKKAGGTLTLTTTAGATDIITMRWDGTNWVEASRALNVS